MTNEQVIRVLIIRWTAAALVALAVVIPIDLALNPSHWALFALVWLVEVPVYLLWATRRFPIRHP